MNPDDEIEYAERLFRFVKSRTGLDDGVKAKAALYVSQAYARRHAHNSHETVLSELLNRVAVEADIWAALGWLTTMTEVETA